MFCAITTPILLSRYALCILLSFLIYMIAFALIQKKDPITTAKLNCSLTGAINHYGQKILTWPDHARDKSIFFIFFYLYIYFLY